MRFGTASGRTLGALHAIGVRSRPVDATTDCRSLALPTIAEADRHHQVRVLKRRILRDITERSVPRLIKPSIRATPVTRTCKLVQLAQQEQKWRRQENFGERVAIIMPNPDGCCRAGDSNHCAFCAGPTERVRRLSPRAVARSRRSAGSTGHGSAIDRYVQDRSSVSEARSD